MSPYHIHMATIYNSDLTKELVDGAKIQVNRDSIPNQLAEKVVPTMETHPEILRKDIIIANFFATATNASTATVRSAGTIGDIYITGYEWHIVKDALCDVGTAVKSIVVTINGASVSLAMAGVMTLTAQDVRLVSNFTHPIKIDFNSAITTTAFSYTAGTAVRSLVIYGYIVNNRNA